MKTQFVKWIIVANFFLVWGAGHAESQQPCGTPVAGPLTNAIAQVLNELSPLAPNVNYAALAGLEADDGTIIGQALGFQKTNGQFVLLWNCPVADTVASGSTSNPAIAAAEFSTSETARPIGQGAFYIDGNNVALEVSIQGTGAIVCSNLSTKPVCLVGGEFPFPTP